MKTKSKTKKPVRKVYPVRNAFTFAEELALRYQWPTFIFDGRTYTPFATVKQA